MFHDNQTFSSFSVDDLAAAKAFYGGTLGLDIANDPQGGPQQGGLRITLANGGMLYIYPKPNHEPASYTMLNFMVSDIDQAVDGLTAKGVAMEHYDLPEIKTDAKGIARNNNSQIAWFKDPAGNILSLVQM